MRFLIDFGCEIREVRKVRADEMAADARETVSKIGYSDGELRIPDGRWRSVFLGAGEEKAVFCVCDHENRVFALEIIDERTYMNGRLIDGPYFFETRAPALANKKLHMASVAGLMFTGLVKAREYVYGYDWDQFRYDALRARLCDPLLTFLLRGALGKKVARYARQYRDVHDGNIMFELRNTDEAGIPMLVRTIDGKHRAVKVGVRAIDVR